MHEEGDVLELLLLLLLVGGRELDFRTGEGKGSRDPLSRPLNETRNRSEVLKKRKKVIFELLRTLGLNLRTCLSGLFSRSERKKGGFVRLFR